MVSKYRKQLNFLNNLNNAESTYSREKIMENCIEATSFEELYKIHDKNYNIGLMNVSNIESKNQRAFLESIINSIHINFRFEIEKSNFEVDLKSIDTYFSNIPESEDKINLVNFIKYLISNYADITDSPSLGVTIEKVENDMCHLYHCDMNTLRLVYPLLGPGTLWAKESNVNREFLGLGRNDLVLKNPSNIYQVPPKTITLLKGNGHFSANNRGVVHASPKISISKEKRILLRIESLY